MPDLSVAQDTAKVHRILCTNIDGMPTTVSIKGDRQVPIIRWTSTDMSDSGFTPEKRCEVVSKKFEDFRSQGTLRFITSGKENGLPVICVALERGGPCFGTLYTLKNKQDASQTLKRLINVRRGASGPLYESGGQERLYINFEELMLGN